MGFAPGRFFSKDRSLDLLHHFPIVRQPCKDINVNFRFCCPHHRNVLQAEIPVIIEQRQVVQKQSRAKFYPFSSYTFSAFLTHAPIAATEVIILGSILYWMTGLSEEAGRFFFFLFLLFCASMTLSTLFRIVSVASTNMEVAQSQG